MYRDCWIYYVKSGKIQAVFAKLKFNKNSSNIFRKRTLSEEYPTQSIFGPSGSGGCTTFHIRLKQSGAREAMFVKPPERPAVKPLALRR